MIHLSAGVQFKAGKGKFNVSSAITFSRRSTSFRVNASFASSKVFIGIQGRF